MLNDVRPGRVSFLLLTLLFPAFQATGQSPADPPDYKIAFWYWRSDPLNTFHSQVYDVRKGQYTRAVDDWLRTMKADFPHYAAYIKEVRLKPGDGQDAEKQLARIILREQLDKGGPYSGLGVRDAYGIYGGIDLGDLVNPGLFHPQFPLQQNDDASHYIRGYGFVSTPGANRPPWYAAPPSLNWRGIPTPFPYPIVRPHP